MTRPKKPTLPCTICHYEGRTSDYWGEAMCSICATTPVSLSDDVRATIAWTVRLLKPTPKRTRR